MRDNRSPIDIRSLSPRERSAKLEDSNPVNDATYLFELPFEKLTLSLCPKANGFSAGLPALLKADPMPPAPKLDVAVAAAEDDDVGGGNNGAG
uniref:Uncharacterized protein n=1 Tax=Romanomermis culicivorax TaxID=13658 RepID=A0A915IKD6_ROMCU